MCKWVPGVPLPIHAVHPVQHELFEYLHHLTGISTPWNPHLKRIDSTVAAQEEKVFSEDASALVNTAYSTLKAPLDRAAYMVRPAATAPSWSYSGA